MTPLDRARALTWLRERDIDAELGDPFHLTADETVLAGVVLRRLWHSPATLRPPLASDQEALLLLVPLEGSFSVSVDGSTSRIVAGRRWAAVPPGSRATITTTTPSARLELVARPARLGTAANGTSSIGTTSIGTTAIGTAATRLTPLVASSSAIGALVASSNAILDARTDPADPSVPALAAALESLLSAVLEGAAPA